MSEIQDSTLARPLLLEGRVFVLRDAKGALIDDIDTDMIFHNAHLAITDRVEMGRHALGNLTGYEHFAKEAQPGDLVLAGRNFGAGSSRQQAVDCFISLGVTCLLAESFGAIYKRNAINAGFPILEAAGLGERLNSDGTPWLMSGDRLSVDLSTGLCTRLSDGATHRARPLSIVAKDIYLAGDLFAYGRTLA